MKEWIQDAGHGGADSGALGNGIIEKIYTLEAATYVNTRLNNLGIGSDITRTKDTTLSSTQRTDIVKKYKKCMSHHINAGGGAGAEFIKSIYSNGSFEKLLKEEFEKAGYPVRRIFDRKGVRGDYYFMHRETGKCRTTIVEYDFLDGANAHKLKDKDYRIGMYECVIRAVCKDEGIKYIPVKVEVVKDDKLKIENESEIKYYRIIAGTFKEKENALSVAEHLRRTGYDCFIELVKK